MTQTGTAPHRVVRAPHQKHRRPLPPVQRPPAPRVEDLPPRRRGHAPGVRNGRGEEAREVAGRLQRQEPCGGRVWWEETNRKSETHARASDAQAARSDVAAAPFCCVSQPGASD